MDLDNFIIGKQRRGEGRFGKKNNSCLTNIERKMCKKSSCCFPSIEDRKGDKNRGDGRFDKKNSCCLLKKATATIPREPSKQSPQHALHSSSY